MNTDKYHDKWQILKPSRDHNHALLSVICYPVARIDIAYLCAKFDDFRFGRSSDIIGAPEIFNGSHDFTTSLSGMVCRP